MRQRSILREYDPKRGVCARTLAHDYPSGSIVHDHAHGSDQLIYATRGLMEVHAGQSVWLIPPTFSISIPARTVHGIRMDSAVSMRTLYFRPGLLARTRSSCAVLSVNALLRELILEAVRIGQLYTRNSEHCALRDLITLHVARAISIPTQVSLPREPRALSIALQLISNPAESRSIQSLCAEAGVGNRTLQRIFVNDLGVDLDTWRRQVRLTKAIEFLVAGSSIKEIAFAVGYSQPSAFVSAFRRTFGSSPKAWVNQLHRV